MAAAFDLDDYLPYLVNRVATRFVATFSRDLRESGIALPMWRVLAVLWHHGPMRLGALAERTTIELSTLSRSIGGMERRGLVTRRREEPDARAVQVALTESGSALTQRLIPAALACEAAALRVLSAGEAEELRRLLRRTHEALAEPARH